jgi:exopolysaccharide biosynthesis polyprenyl glycosylphosphotransferase
MRNNASFAYAIVLIIGDFLALIAAFSAAYILRVKVDPRPVIEQIPAFDYLQTVLVVLPLWIIVNGLLGLYNPDVYERRFSEIGRLLIGSFIGILVVIGYDFVTQASIFPARLVPVYGLFIGFGFLFLFRTLVRITRRYLYRTGFGVSNIVIVGDTEASQNLATNIGDTRSSGFKILAIVGPGTSRIKSYTNFEDAIKHLRSPIHAIIQTELYKDQDKNNEILRYSQEHHISYRFVPGNSDLFVGNIDVELLAGMPVVAVHQTALIGWGRIVKRLFDIFAASIILIITSPILLLVAFILKLSDLRAPVFFRQTRLTRFNREFKVFKFRTHRADISGLSDEEAFKKIGKPELYEQYKSGGYVLQKDPRISRIGRFLRRTSIDELPQLFNVLKGDLSLVGPRTLIPAELNTYERKHAILSVKAGLTGLAQISGREDISFDERRKLDVYYVQNWSFWLDISILLRTIRVVIFGVGAK